MGVKREAKLAAVKKVKGIWIGTAAELGLAGVGTRQVTTTRIGS